MKVAKRLFREREVSVNRQEYPYLYLSSLYTMSFFSRFPEFPDIVFPTVYYAVTPIYPHLNMLSLSLFVEDKIGKHELEMAEQDNKGRYTNLLAVLRKVGEKTICDMVEDDLHQLQEGKKISKTVIKLHEQMLTDTIISHTDLTISRVKQIAIDVVSVLTFANIFLSPDKLSYHDKAIQNGYFALTQQVIANDSIYIPKDEFLKPYLQYSKNLVNNDELLLLTLSVKAGKDNKYLPLLRNYMKLLTGEEVGTLYEHIKEYITEEEQRLWEQAIENQDVALINKLLQDKRSEYERLKKEVTNLTEQVTEQVERLAEELETQEREEEKSDTTNSYTHTQQVNYPLAEEKAIGKRDIHFLQTIKKIQNISPDSKITVVTNLSSARVYSIFEELNIPTHQIEIVRGDNIRKVQSVAQGGSIIIADTSSISHAVSYLLRSYIVDDDNLFFLPLQRRYLKGGDNNG